LFCGDLFENVKQPGLGEIKDDLEEAKASANRLLRWRFVLFIQGTEALFDGWTIWQR
jgi:hypothetical protein